MTTDRQALPAIGSCWSLGKHEIPVTVTRIDVPYIFLASETRTPYKAHIDEWVDGLWKGNVRPR